MKRRTEITIETERVVVIELPRRTLLAWCAGCDAETEMMTAFDAAALAGVSSYTVYGWSESGEIHSRVTPDGELFICPASLARASVSANEDSRTGAQPSEFEKRR